MKKCDLVDGVKIDFQYVLCVVADVLRIEFSKESYLFRSTHLGSPLSTYTLKFVKIFDLGQIYAPKMPICLCLFPPSAKLYF